MNDLQRGMAAHRESIRPDPAAPTPEQAVARALTAFRPDTAGTVTVAELVEEVRRALPPRYRKRLKRCEVIDALAALGIPVGLVNRRQAVIGFTAAPAPVVLVDEKGKVRAA